LVLLASRIDFARLKNCEMYWAMSSGFASTSSTRRRETLAISLSHSVANGSAVATVSVVALMSTGRMLKRAA